LLLGSLLDVQHVGTDNLAVITQRITTPVVGHVQSHITVLFFGCDLPLMSGSK
jgi:hypothetical protein